MPKELLLEIGHEEIPASYMGPALSQIKELAQKFLTEAGFSFSKISATGTPRRMALCVSDLQEAKLPKGSLASSELKKILPKIITSIYFPKSMRWHDFDVRFARPLRWIVSLYDGKVINFPFEGINPDKFSFGHRFLAPEKFEVKSFEQYKSELKKRFVVLDHKERKNFIKTEVERIAKEHSGKVLPDDKLFETVNWLVEWPVVLLGTFKKEFLELPKEVLITSMRSHQKYFAVADEKENLLPFFITISNMKVANPEVIVRGNEKVLTARLTDAQFLYNADKKISLAKRVEKLKNVVFQEKLGTMFDKTQRLVKLTEFIMREAKLPKGSLASKNDIQRIAYLAKADLVTEMVGEFPDLQGTMGKYYAKLSGEKDIIASAIEEHYLPRYANDRLPETKEGAIVSLSDKTDSLVGYFGIGLKPTATEDPYALRRQALGILQIIWNAELNVPLAKLLDKTMSLYKKNIKNSKKIKQELLDFLLVRLANILESKKVPKQVIEAVLSLGFDDLGLVKKRLNAVNSAKAIKEFEQFKSAMKRVRNILPEKFAKKAVKNNLLKEQEEKNLHKAFSAIEKDFYRQIKNGDYKIALEILMKLAPAINNFFDKVLVMAKEKNIRDNRTALVGNIYLLTKEIADFSKLI
jgi:glycyl-tRNA synthetase beta chain